MTASKAMFRAAAVASAGGVAKSNCVASDHHFPGAAPPGEHVRDSGKTMDGGDLGGGERYELSGAELMCTLYANTVEN